MLAGSRSGGGGASMTVIRVLLLVLFVCGAWYVMFVGGWAAGFGASSSSAKGNNNNNRQVVVHLHGLDGCSTTTTTVLQDMYTSHEVSTSNSNPEPNPNLSESQSVSKTPQPQAQPIIHIHLNTPPIDAQAQQPAQAVELTLKHQDQEPKQQQQCSSSGSGSDWCVDLSRLSMAPSELSSCLSWLEGELPYKGVSSPGSPASLRAHHWDAGNGDKWNQDQRFLPLPDLTAAQGKCVIWYAGGNTHGEDGIKLQQTYHCSMAVFEPVPQYYKHLTQHYQRQEVQKTTVYGYGLGANTRQVKNVQLAGQSTFAMEGGTDTDADTDTNTNQPKGTGVDLQIHAASDVYDHLVRYVWSSGVSDGSDSSSDSDSGIGMIDLLHSNCEGCEWELVESLIATGLVTRVRHLQLSFHYFPYITDFRNRYCKIMHALNQTHTPHYQQPFGWERWDRRNHNTKPKQ